MKKSIILYFIIGAEAVIITLLLFQYVKNNSNDISTEVSMLDPGFRVQSTEPAATESETVTKAITQVSEITTVTSITTVPETEGNICIFEESCSMNDLRNIVNICIKKCTGICAAFSGNDKNGYQYIIASVNTDLKSRSGEINDKISGKGGGSSTMIQGSSSGCRSDIKAYIENFK